MQAEVASLLIFNVNLGLAFPALPLGHLRFTVLDWSDFNLAADQVVARPARDTLSELAMMIGYQIPRGMIFAQGMDPDLNSIEGAIIRAVGGAENKPVGFFVLVLVGLINLWFFFLAFFFLGFLFLAFIVLGFTVLGGSRIAQTKSGHCHKAGESNRTQVSNHRLRLPRLSPPLPRPHRTLRLDSAPGGSW